MLILTNLSWVRNPYGDPKEKRPHSTLLRPSIFNFTSIQTKRKLTREDVVHINHIIKQRASRYVAAAKEEWLYPERESVMRWDKIGTSYMLMSDPRSVTFSSETITSYESGSVDAFDEYGRKPWHSGYLDKKRKDAEWISSQTFKSEYARIFGPLRRVVTFEMGRTDRLRDSDDYHVDTVSLEKKYMSQIKKYRRK